jgi:hypothetical protein
MYECFMQMLTVAVGQSRTIAVSSALKREICPLGGLPGGLSDVQGISSLHSDLPRHSTT